MKVFVLPVLLLFLSGCGSLATDRMFSNNLLDTAPRHDSEVRHPDWRLPPLSARIAAYVAHKETQVEPTIYSHSRLEQFLRQQGLDYEVFPGDHTMIKLNHPVRFSTGSAAVPPSSLQQLVQLGSFLASERQIDIVLEGHTDDTGSERLNDNLSIQRAESVKNILLNQQLSPSTIYTRGYGLHAPVCSNQTSQGRACNRRVEILMIVGHQ